VKHFLLLSLVLIVGCNKGPSLKPLERLIIEPQSIPREFASVGATFQTRKARRVSGKLNVVMIVDTSLSNHHNRDSAQTLLPGTDEFGQARFATLKLFVDSFSSYNEEDRKNIFFSLITFDSVARLKSGFTNDLDKFKGVVQKEIDELADNGATDMPLALIEAHKLISEDIALSEAESEPKKGNYVIIFVTDGVPMRVVNNTRYDIPMSEIESEIQRINGLGVNKSNVQSITLNSGYYCSSLCGTPEGILGKQVTQKMAVAGGGEALFFEEEGINYQRYALPVTKVKYQARDMRVRNLSVNWKNGVLALDADQDGIVDSEEESLGSDPLQKDSDGDGISDGVQRMMTGTVCGSFNAQGKCNVVTSARYDSCQQYMVSNASPIQYALSQDRYTNKCELALLEADPEGWELGDWMPYIFRTLSGLSFLRNVGDLSLDPDKDGKNNYEEILRGTDPYSAGHADDPEYEYSLQLINATDDFDEYHLEIQNISTIGEGNLFAVYLLEHAPTGDTKRYIRVAQARFQNKRIELVDEDFQ